MYVWWFLCWLHQNTERNPNQQRRILNKLPTELQYRNYVTTSKHRLSIQIGAKLAKACMQCVYVYSNRASILHATVSGWDGDHLLDDQHQSPHLPKLAYAANTSLYHCYTHIGSKICERVLVFCGHGRGGREGGGGGEKRRRRGGEEEEEAATSLPVDLSAPSPAPPRPETASFLPTWEDDFFFRARGPNCYWTQMLELISSRRGKED